MASKEMAYFNVGNDEFEIVDDAGRQATSAVDEKVDGLSASNLPYSSTQSTKQKIDEVDGKRISFTQIFFALELPTTDTSYNCDWSSFDALSLEIVFYGNSRTQMTIPTSYFNQTSSGNRPQLYDTTNQYGIEIYKNTNNSIYIKANKQSATLGARIYGIKLG